MNDQGQIEQHRPGVDRIVICAGNNRRLGRKLGVTRLPRANLRRLGRQRRGVLVQPAQNLRAGERARSTPVGERRLQPRGRLLGDLVRDIQRI
jgi:hypothetical protein